MRKFAWEQNNKIKKSYGNCVKCGEKIFLKKIKITYDVRNLSDFEINNTVSVTRVFRDQMSVTRMFYLGNGRYIFLQTGHNLFKMNRVNNLISSL